MIANPEPVLVQLQYPEPDLVQINRFNGRMVTKLKKKASRRGARTPKTKSALRGVVADKVKARLVLLYGAKSYDGWLKDVRHTGLTKGSLQRVLAGDSGLTIEILEQLAKAVKLELPQLFEPLKGRELMVVSMPGYKSVDNNHGLS